MIKEIFNNNIYDSLNSIKRWSGLNTIKQESVSEHSFMVSIFTRIICEELIKENEFDLKLKILTYSLFHDFDEIFTGDLNHNLKYNDFNGDGFRLKIDEFIEAKIEATYIGKDDSTKLLKDNLKMDDYFVKSIVKVSDWISMLYFLKREISMGNVSLKERYSYCKDMFEISCFKTDNYMFDNVSDKVKDINYFKKLKICLL